MYNKRNSTWIVVKKENKIMEKGLKSDRQVTHPT
jgi:hypothetical protein